jgi:phosphoserine phosphatase
MFDHVEHRLSEMPQYPENFPICIDLDGTLVKEHTLWHLNWNWKLHHLYGLFSTRWPAIKSTVADAGQPDHKRWTYHHRLEDQMRLWHAQGARLYLVTGAPKKIADYVADRMGLFTDVWCSSSTHNLVGPRKAAHLRYHFGVNGYTYIGDSWQDRAVWETSKDVITVAPPASKLFKHLQRSIRKDQRLFCIPHEFGAITPTPPCHKK